MKKLAVASLLALTVVIEPLAAASPSARLAVATGRLCIKRVGVFLEQFEANRVEPSGSFAPVNEGEFDPFGCRDATLRVSIPRSILGDIPQFGRYDTVSRALYTTPLMLSGTFDSRRKLFTVRARLTPEGIAMVQTQFFERLEGSPADYFTGKTRRLGPDGRYLYFSEGPAVSESVATYARLTAFSGYADIWSNGSSTVVQNEVVDQRSVDQFLSTSNSSLLVRSRVRLAP